MISPSIRSVGDEHDERALLVKLKVRGQSSVIWVPLRNRFAGAARRITVESLLPTTGVCGTTAGGRRPSAQGAVSSHRSVPVLGYNKPGGLATECGLLRGFGGV